MANLPDDIIHSCILPKLPVKSLLRFKCVSKSWLALITSRDFIRFHHRHVLSSDRNRLIITPVDDPSTYFHVYNLDAPHDPPSKCSYFNPKVRNRHGVRGTIVASCEFFLLLGIGVSYGRYKALFLVNPSTHSYHEIPCQISTVHRKPSTKYGICFDEANDDVKVVKITFYKDSDVPYPNAFMEVMMYSFKTNLWRLIERKLTSDVFYEFIGFNGVYVVNNVLYTILLSTSPDLDEYVRIACFDVHTEQWTNDLPLPDSNVQCYTLRLLDGSICVIEDEYDYKNHRNHCVWVMKDRWVKLMSIDCNNIPWDERFELQPITYRTGSRHELLCNRKGFRGSYWYNLRDKVAKNAEFNDEWGDHMEVVCKGSLLMFPNLLPLPGSLLMLVNSRMLIATLNSM